MLERVRDSYEFPTDLSDDGDTGGALRWTVGVIATTAVLLALTNAGAISGWAASFDPRPAVLPLIAAADRWDAATGELGLALPHARMHSAWKRVENVHWSPDETRSRAP